MGGAEGLRLVSKNKINRNLHKFTQGHCHGVCTNTNRNTMTASNLITSLMGERERESEKVNKTN